MSEERIPKCSIRDSRFVEPCTALSEVVAGEGVGSRKGVLVWNFISVSKRKPARSMIGVRSGDIHKNGVVFNFCPFCGTDISAPFMREEEAA